MLAGLDSPVRPFPGCLAWPPGPVSHARAGDGASLLDRKHSLGNRGCPQRGSAAAKASLQPPPRREARREVSQLNLGVFSSAVELVVPEAGGKQATAASGVEAAAGGAPRSEQNATSGGRCISVHRRWI